MGLSLKEENRIILGGLMLYWALFWIFNVVDKFMGKWPVLWEGKDRLTQFVNYFASINIDNPLVAKLFLTAITILEIIALVYLVMALYYYFKKNPERTRTMFFMGILVSLIIFSIFSIGDQIFRDRTELWEHTFYWISLVISWFIFNKCEK